VHCWKHPDAHHAPAVILALMTGLLVVPAVSQDRPPKPASADLPSLVIPTTHVDEITSLAMSADGNFVLTGSYDGSARLWDWKSGLEIRQFQHKSVNTVAIAVRMDVIATGGFDGDCRIWQLQTGALQRTISFGQTLVNAVAFTPDGAAIAVGTDDGLSVWNVHSGELLSKPSTGTVKSLAYSHDGSMLVAGFAGGEIEVLETARWKTTATLKGHDAWVWSVAFSPRDDEIISGGNDGTVRRWSSQSWRQLTSYKANGNVWSIAVSPDGRYVAAGSEGNGPQVWDHDGREVSLGSETHAVHGLTFSKDGDNIISAGDDHLISVRRLSSNRVVRRFPAQADPVGLLVMSSTGRYMLSVNSESGVANVWDMQSGRRTIFNAGQLGHPQSGAFSTDEKHAFTITANGKNVTEWSVEDGSTKQVMEATSSILTVGTLSHDGTRIVTGDEDGGLRVWNVDDGRETQRYSVSRTAIRSIAISPDDKFIVSGAEDGNARVQEGDRTILTLAHANSVTCVAYFPDGNSILTSEEKLSTGEGQRSYIWRASDGVKLHTVQGGHSCAVSSSGHKFATLEGATVRIFDERGTQLRQLEYTNALEKIAFSDDGRTIVVGSTDDTGVIFDVETGKVIRSLVGHKNPIGGVSFFRGGTSVITSSPYDDTVRVWDAGTGTQVCEADPFESAKSAFPGRSNDLIIIVAGTAPSLWSARTCKEIRAFEEHASAFEGIAVTPNGQTLVTHDAGINAYVWDLADGKETHKLKGHSAWIASVGISPDGKRIITGSFDGTARIWDIQSGESIRTLRGHQYGVDVASWSIDGKEIITADGIGRVIRIWNAESGALLHTFDLNDKLSDITVAQLSLDNKKILASGGVGIHASEVGPDLQALVLDGDSGETLATLKPAASAVYSSTYVGTHPLIATANSDGTIAIWDSGQRQIICQLIYSGENSWAVVSGSRFDTDNFDTALDLHWVMPDDPLHALPLEIFMRDYYEPDLLGRLLAGETFRDLRPLASLNRVQPGVEIEQPEWVDATGGLVKVTVRVKRNKELFPRNDKDVEVSTGVYDLRLFRDGQLVGWAPKTSVDWQLEPTPTGPKADDLDLARWRDKTEIRDLGKDGSKELTFQVQVPRRADLKQVVFTAYAFNEDRVKSATASASLLVDKPLQPRKGKAYLITVGVNRTESSPAWDLHYAATDARQMNKVVGDSLQGTQQFSDVVRIRLVSDSPEQREADESVPTKAHLQAVLDVLAGRRRVDEQLKKEIPGIEGVEKAEPEDLVLLSFSSHGYTDTRGVFHVVLEDIGKNTPQDRITEALQQNSLSSDVLSAWLRDVDAGEMTMIVDACHSEATVAAEGFKPGPMGSRGLGQLAYDKGMRILAASKSNEEAMEVGGTIGQGLLTYALVKEGLLDRKAAKDGKVYMSSWLNYGEQEVPNLYKSGEVKGPGGKPVAPNGRDIIYLGPDKSPSAYQQPVLFDFNKQHTDILLSTR